MLKELSKKILTSTAALGLAMMTAAPALAGGSFAITLVPSDADEANAMRAGLAMYSLIQGIEANGGITQNGMNNVAGILQGGSGNSAVIHQEGNGHHGTIDQQGNNNAYGLFQFGENTNADISQYGNGQTGTTIVFGW